MALFTQVNPESFIDLGDYLPAHGRGSWVKEGIEFGYRISRGTPTIGTVAEKSLAHWCVAAASYGVQKRLIALGALAPIDTSEYGIWGPKSDAALRAFQGSAKDPLDGSALTADGYLGQSDSRALWTPLIDAAERKYGIPSHLLRGEVAHESAMDPAAVGYYIYYADGGAAGALTYRGVDRGLCQINSLANKAVTWAQAYDPAFAIDWSGVSMRSYYDRYWAAYRGATPDTALWDAALCSHNNPTWGAYWARYGAPPNDSAALYVSSVKAARY